MPHSDQLLNYDALCARGINYSKAHLGRLSRAGQFPKPVKLSSARNAWLSSEIDEWVAARLTARNVPPPEAA
jgi:prophage regulatory protein